MIDLKARFVDSGGLMTACNKVLDMIQTEDFKQEAEQMVKDFNINDVLDRMEEALVEMYIEEGEAIERDLNGDDSMYDGYLTTTFELNEKEQ